jgi:hypothetical protein
MTASSGVVLSNLAYLLGAVVLAIIGGVIVWLHHRQPKSVDANVESFHRGLRALAPDSTNRGSSRTAATGAPEGLRIRPRSSVTLPAAGEQGDRAEDSASGENGRDDAADEDPGPEPVVVDLSRQETQHQAAAGDGAGDRAGAETG